MNTQAVTPPGGESAPATKKPYSAPVLTVFGDVAALTQSATGCNQSDSTGCTVQAGSNMGPTMASERAMKESIVRIGTHPMGFGLYLFDYKPAHRDRWGHGRQFGVMADEVESIVPQAVSRHEDGHRVVDYALIGVRPFLH